MGSRSENVGTVTREGSRVEQDDVLMDDDSDSSEYVDMWIDLFLGRKGHEYFCDVDPEYITDRFNLMNLQKTVSKFSYVVQYIVDDLDDSILENMTHARLEQLESDSRKLYGLIHARYIITIKGLQKCTLSTKRRTLEDVPVCIVIYNSCYRLVCMTFLV